MTQFAAALATIHEAMHAEGARKYHYLRGAQRVPIEAVEGRLETEGNSGPDGSWVGQTRVLLIRVRELARFSPPLPMEGDRVLEASGVNGREVRYSLVPVQNGGREYEFTDYTRSVIRVKMVEEF